MSFRPPTPSVEPSPRWVRVKVGDTEIASSKRALLLVWYGPGKLPTYCIPGADVDSDFLRPKPDNVGEFWVDHDVIVGDTVLPRAAKHFFEPPPDLAALDGHWTFEWDTGLSWYEEALEVHVHARDPNKRVDAVPSDRHVRVEIDGQVIAESHRPHALFETWLPTRWYLPSEDVDHHFVVPSATVTRCPYKGTATYVSARVGDRLHQDVGWTYLDPIPECPRINGLVAFFNEKVDLMVDGERLGRPITPWS